LQETETEPETLDFDLDELIDRSVFQSGFGFVATQEACLNDFDYESNAFKS